MEQGYVAYPDAKCLSNIDDRGSKTVEENIDLKIASLKAEIQRLEESKATLAPLLNMRIRDIREAMTY